MHTFDASNWPGTTGLQGKDSAVAMVKYHPFGLIIQHSKPSRTKEPNTAGFKVWGDEVVNFVRACAGALTAEQRLDLGLELANEGRAQMAGPDLRAVNG